MSAPEGRVVHCDSVGSHNWGLTDGATLVGCLGPLSSAQAGRLGQRLAVREHPGDADPAVPWAAGVRRVDGSILLATSTLWAPGIFWSTTPEGRLTWGADLGAVVGAHAATALNEQWITDRLTLTPDALGGDVTPYLGVHRIPPGCSVLINRSGTAKELTSWSSSDWPDVGSLAGTPAVAEFRGAFRSAVLRMADCAGQQGPIVLSLSGGLDSTYLAAVLLEAGYPVHGLVSSPLPGAPLLSAPGRVADDLPWAHLLARRYPDLLGIEPVRNYALRAPLDAAADLSSRAWWPCLSADNSVWMEQVRGRAAALGATALFIGSHGNWSFSPEFASPRRHSLTIRMRRRAAAKLRFWSSSPNRRRTVGKSRDLFLHGLARRGASFDPLESPAALGNDIWIADPYADRQVLDVSARIATSQWQCQPGPRGFARLVAEGLVPDPIRLRRSRGAQAPDAWAWIKGQRAMYESRIDALEGTPIIPDVVDVPRLRDDLLAWHWGTDQAPRMADQIAAHRVLAMADFIRITTDRLASMRTSPMQGADRKSAR